MSDDDAHRETLLQRQLAALLPGVDDRARAAFRERLAWIELGAGRTLMAQGDAGDAMYLLVRGRLRAFVRGRQGANGGDGVEAAGERAVRDIGRGQFVGEISLFTGEPRSATLVAVRDCLLARLDAAAFHELLSLGAGASVALVRQTIRRLQTEAAPPPPDRPVTMALAPISAGVDGAGFAGALGAALRDALARAPVADPRVAVVDASAVDAALGAGAARSADADAAADARIAMHLEGVEAAHGAVLLLADADDTPWTRRCLRHADEILLLADAGAPPALHAVERDLLAPRPAGSGAADVLVLLHPPDRSRPAGTRAWLARRPVADHVHVRPALPRDLARLARLQARTATGLVLAGGGARGLAHLGVLQALAERGIEVDVAGGTSIGSVMAACAASDRSPADVVAAARAAFATNPTGDVNWLPLVSLIRGRRLRQVVDRSLAGLLGGPCDAEDLWKGWFGVATNYSRARQDVLRSGPLRDALLASMAIPGALPPVVRDGDLLCDGGTLNNFPVDVMRGMRGVARVIGVDLGARHLRRLERDDVPGSWTLLWDRLRPGRRRRWRLPTLPTYLMTVSVLYSLSRRAEAQAQTDLYLNPPLPRVGMLDWKRFDAIVSLGREHALQRLDAGGPGRGS